MKKNILIAILILVVFAGVFYLLKEKDINPSLNLSESNLDLSYKELKKVPDNIFTNNSLVILDLSHNLLTGSLQAEIRNLSNLTTLDLSNNEFTGLPAEIGQLSKLEYLDVSNNKLTGLPLELGNLKKLKQLNIKGNNYSVYDLEKITKNLPNTVEIIK